MENNVDIGEIWNADGVRVIDSRAMPWASPPKGEPFHGTLTKTKVLSRAAEGWPIVQMLSRPSGAKSSYPHGQAERHYHRTTREWVYILSGVLALREFPDIRDPLGIPVDYREGYFLDRHPGRLTWHGLNPEGSSDGYIGIEFRTGPGQAPGEEGHSVENVSVLDSEAPNYQDSLEEISPGFIEDFEQPEALVYNTTHVRVIDTRELRWLKPDTHPFGAGDHVHVRPLTKPLNGKHALEQIHLGRSPGSELQSEAALSREVWFVLSGSGSLIIGQQRIELKPGMFVDSAEGSRREVESNSSPTGIVLLVWRMPASS